MLVFKIIESRQCILQPFFDKSKNSRQKSKYLENEKIFSGEMKSIFYHF